MDTSKPIAAVWFDETIARNTDCGLCVLGDPIPEALAALAALRTRCFVVIVSPILNTQHGVRCMLEWLHSHNVPYDDVCDNGLLPCADEWYHTGALPLCH